MKNKQAGTLPALLGSSILFAALTLGPSGAAKAVCEDGAWQTSWASCTSNFRVSH